MGYVVKHGGKYLCRQKTITHTGTHVFETWTEDLNKATVFYDPRKKHLFGDDVKFIEAAETRTVTLVSPSEEVLKHNWKFIGCSPHNGEYWYKCENCGASDWIASYGTLDQLLPEECNPPTSPQQQGETQ